MPGDIQGFYNTPIGYSVLDSFSHPLNSKIEYNWRFTPDDGYLVLGSRNTPVINVIWLMLNIEPEYRVLTCDITNNESFCEENTVELNIHFSY